MYSRIEEFCVNNNAPSDEILQEVKNLLQKPCQYIKDLDLEILTLERRILELKAKRDDAKRWISRYQPIVSPIRNLPRDVLAEIFRHCLPLHTNPTMKGTESPLLLTRVCKSWRSVAFSEPRLWSKIHIVFTELTSPSVRDQAILRTRLDAVKEWLLRSGTTPLSISLHFREAGTGPQYSPITLELLRFLSQLSPRFEELELTMPIEIFVDLESMMDHSKMTNLTYFRISSLTRPLVMGNVRPLYLLKAPNLRRVSTFRCDSSFWGVSEPSYASVWSKLTNISCHSFLPKDTAVSLLAHTTNLVHLAITIFDCRDDQDIIISHRGPISLPFLRTLLLSDGMPSRTRGDFYDRIDAPDLRWIMFKATSTNSRDSSQPIPILSLLSKATGLEKLSIKPPLWDMRSMFQAVPSITHLFLGYESKIQHVSVPTERLLFDFESLSSSSATDHPPLLSNLQSFEINTQLVVIENEGLLPFLKYRMAPPANSGISILKHFAYEFYYPHEHSLVEDIRRHAQLRGVEMLDLVFGKEPEILVERTKVPERDSGLVELEAPTGADAEVNNYIRF